MKPVTTLEMHEGPEAFTRFREAVKKILSVPRVTYQIHSEAVQKEEASHKALVIKNWLIGSIACVAVLIWLVRVVKWAWNLPDDSVWANYSLLIGLALVGILFLLKNKKS